MAPLLTIEDAAARLGIKISTLRHRMKTRGPCGAFKLGRRYYWHAADLENSPLSLAG